MRDHKAIPAQSVQLQEKLLMLFLLNKVASVMTTSKIS